MTSKYHWKKVAESVSMIKGLFFLKYMASVIQCLKGQERLITYCFNSEHYQIFQVSSEFIQLRLNLGVTIEWNGKSRLYVKADQKWKNRVCGVCGNFNDNKRDDLMNINGTGL